MDSVTVGQPNSTLVELGRRRLADTDLLRRTIADRVQSPPCDRALVSPDLVGRAAELGIIRSLLEDVAHGGGALVLSGEPGIGKTRLLDAAERAAPAIGITTDPREDHAAGGRHVTLGELREHEEPVLASRLHERSVDQDDGRCGHGSLLTRTPGVAEPDARRGGSRLDRSSD